MASSIASIMASSINSLPSRLTVSGFMHRNWHVEDVCDALCLLRERGHIKAFEAEDAFDFGNGIIEIYR